MKASAHRDTDTRSSLTLRLGFALGLVLLISVGALWSAVAGSEESPFGSNARKSGTGRILNVPVTRVRWSTHYQLERSFLGRLEANRRSALGFELAGKISRVLVDEGAIVRQGQDLAMLDTRRQEAQKVLLEASLARAHAALRLAQVTRKRVGEAVELNAVSTQRADEAEQNLQVQQAMVQEAEASLEVLAVELGKSRLQAPFSGVILRRTMDEGRVVQPGEVLLELQEEGPLVARVGISLQAGSALNRDEDFSLLIAGQKVSATFRALLPRLDPRLQTLELLLVLQDSGSHFLPGQPVEIILPRQMEESGFWLPWSALSEGARGLWACSVAVPLKQDEGAEANLVQLEIRQLELLHQNAEGAYVRGVVEDGEWVASAGLQKIVPGQILHAVENQPGRFTGEVP